MQRYPRDNTRQVQEIKLQQNKTKKTLKMISCRVIPKVYKGISLHFIEIHPNFHMSYGILLRKYKNVMIKP
jgi:hypothetical protein